MPVRPTPPHIPLTHLLEFIAPPPRRFYPHSPLLPPRTALPAKATECRMTFGRPQRRKVIKAIFDGKSITSIAQQEFAPSRSQIQRWLRHFLLTASYDTPCRGRRIRRFLILRAHQDYLLDYLRNVNPVLYLDEMQVVRAQMAHMAQVLHGIQTHLLQQNGSEVEERQL